MRSGLPIISSKFSPMPEFLGPSEFYFDPTDVNDLCAQLKRFLEEPQKRYEAAKNSYARSFNYDWEECSRQTFNELWKLIKFKTNVSR
jgi:glycosyltransferase involved in cell wall biosynthesis